MRSIAWLLVPAALLAQPTVTDLLEARTLEALAGLERSLGGVLGVAAVDLQTGWIFGRNLDTVFPQASAIKIPIMVEVFRAARAGRIRLEERVRLGPADIVGGSGSLQQKLRRNPVELTVRELTELMIRDSDNVATNRLIGLVGMEEVNRTLDSLGLFATRLRRRMMDSAAATRDEENVSTPREMARLAELLYRERLVDGDACRQMLAIMKTVEAGMRKAVPRQVPVASKPGALPGVRCETGIVFLPGRPFALSVMGTFLGDQEDPVQSVTRILYSHFDRLARSNRYGHRVR
ncbi:MAG: serine hydrolase [Bryobacterales bacterium]|nr:class A beta-lactamase-related serine hydrolase [Bryobacteraceae bacterium]MDW8130890.1 serine hydrolase [Bryobacterales bacterium]